MLYRSWPFDVLGEVDTACKGPCLPVPGPIPRAGSLRIALLAVASRRCRCFRCLSRQLTPLPPLLRHRASCRCTHCNSARRQPSRSQALRICSCLPLCRSLPTRRLLLLPLPTPRRPLLRLVNPVCNIFSIFKVRVSGHSCPLKAHLASSSANSASSFAGCWRTTGRRGRGGRRRWRGRTG